MNYSVRLSCFPHLSDADEVICPLSRVLSLCHPPANVESLEFITLVAAADPDSAMTRGLEDDSMQESNGEESDVVTPVHPFFSYMVAHQKSVFGEYCTIKDVRRPFNDC